MPDPQTATVHRMVLPDHVCPWGKRAKELLEEAGYQVEDHQLTSRAEVDAFKEENGLSTTPLVYVGEEKIGGCSDLEAWLDEQG